MLKKVTLLLMLFAVLKTDAAFRPRARSDEKTLGTWREARARFQEGSAFQSVSEKQHKKLRRAKKKQRQSSPQAATQDSPPKLQEAQEGQLLCRSNSEARNLACLTFGLIRGDLIRLAMKPFSADLTEIERDGWVKIQKKQFEQAQILKAQERKKAKIAKKREEARKKELLFPTPTSWKLFTQRCPECARLTAPTFTKTDLARFKKGRSPKSLPLAAGHREYVLFTIYQNAWLYSECLKSKSGRISPGLQRDGNRRQWKRVKNQNKGLKLINHGNRK